MGKVQIKEGCYLTIPYIFREKYNLSCNDMIIAGIIFGFSQDGESAFTGSLSYLQAWTGLTKQGIIKILKKLIGVGVIVKETELKNGVRFCKYKIGGKVTSPLLNPSLPLLNSVEQDGKLSLMGGGKLSLPNNIEIDNKDNNKPTNVGMSSENDAACKIDFEKLMICFNDELIKRGSLIPKLASMTERRKQAVKARIKENGKQALFIVIKKTAASAFLNGRNNRSFVASFDWIIKPNNFVKVLEGNYDDNINNMHNGDNRANTEKEQRAREVAEAISRRLAEDEAEQTGFLGAVQPR